MEMLVYLLSGTMPQTEEDNKEKVVVNPEVYNKVTGEKE
jgi:hypothetical protein